MPDCLFLSAFAKQVASSYAALAALLRGTDRAAEALAYARVAAAAQERMAAASPAAAAAVLAVAEILAGLGRCDLISTPRRPSAAVLLGERTLVALQAESIRP